MVMHLEINDTTAVRHLMETFSNYYPYLKIEFFQQFFLFDVALRPVGS